MQCFCDIAKFLAMAKHVNLCVSHMLCFWIVVYTQHYNLSLSESNMLDSSNFWQICQGFTNDVLIWYQNTASSPLGWEFTCMGYLLGSEE